MTIEDAVLSSGYLPDAALRFLIRRSLEDRLREIATPDRAAATERMHAFVAARRTQPMAVATATANKQHYEVGTGVLGALLGPYMKYSCCWYAEEEGATEELFYFQSMLRPLTSYLWPVQRTPLADAEIAMMLAYMDRADLRDGMHILDLGCGWGACALFFAERLPRAHITAFSNSRTQKTHIDEQARQRGLRNLAVVTGDVVDYEFAAESYDRVVSIELFEHMKNYDLLMAKIARALRPGGALFVHLFCHATTPYDFAGGWMTDFFFAGGTMPSADLLHHCQRDLVLDRQWWVSGRHYARTCDDWLANWRRHRHAVWPDLVATYGAAHARAWFHRWAVFCMACSEMFRYGGGDVWGVSHYLFRKPASRGPTVS